MEVIRAEEVDALDVDKVLEHFDGLPEETLAKWGDEVFPDLPMDEIAWNTGVADEARRSTGLALYVRYWVTFMDMIRDPALAVGEKPVPQFEEHVIAGVKYRICTDFGAAIAAFLKKAELLHGVA